MIRMSPSTVIKAALVVSLAAGWGCKTATEDDNASNVIVRVVDMSAEAGELGGPAEAASDLFSDVCFSNDTVPPCAVFNDNGVVTMTAIVKDRTHLASQINDVVFERYRVTYERADGRNVPGIDVPYAFDGAANFTVPADGTEVQRGFVVVRHQAKRETPLREISLSPTGILSVIARIDFYGRDIAGRAVTVTGYLNITFGDFANE